MLLLFARRLGNVPAAHAFEAGAEWRRVTVPFAQLGLDGTDVQALFVGGGPALGTFRLQFDDVRLEPKEPAGRP
jgi:hypothetical protein